MCLSLFSIARYFLSILHLSHASIHPIMLVHVNGNKNKQNDNEEEERERERKKEKKR